MRPILLYRLRRGENELTILCYILKRIEEVEAEDVTFNNAKLHNETLELLYSLKRRLEEEKWNTE